MKASAVLAIILFCLLLPIQALCTDKPVNDKSKLNVQKAVDAVRKELESKLGNPVPSLNVLIQTRDGLIFVSSVHDGVKPVTKDMNFRFASNTKSFTAAAILKMYQDGWLNYKDKITDIIPGSKKTTYVPDSPDWDIPYKSSITIEQLLQHSSGVFDVDNDANPSWGGDTYTEFKQKSNHNHQFKVDEFTAELVSKNLYYFTPGSGYHYSNTEYAILSRIISRVYSFFAGTAKTYEDYLNDFIVGKKAKIPLNIHFSHIGCRLCSSKPLCSRNRTQPERDRGNY